MEGKQLQVVHTGLCIFDYLFTSEMFPNLSSVLRTDCTGDSGHGCFSLRVAWFWLPREHPPFARCSWCGLFCAFPVSVQQIPLQVWYGHAISHLRPRLVAFEKSDWVSLLAVFTSRHLLTSRS